MTFFNLRAVFQSGKYSLPHHKTMSAQWNWRVKAQYTYTKLTHKSSLLISWSTCRRASSPSPPKKKSKKEIIQLLRSTPICRRNCVLRFHYRVCPAALCHWCTEIPHTLKQDEDIDRVTKNKSPDFHFWTCDFYSLANTLVKIICKLSASYFCN